MSASQQLFIEMQKKAGFEAVSIAEPSPSQLRALGRIPEDLGGLNMGNWKILMYVLYTTMENRPWKADVSKSYFIKPETKKLVFAWRVIIQGENLAQHYKEIADLVRGSPISARSEVTEFPLAGHAANRGRVSGGKRGAGPSSQILVGPAAAQAKLMGG